MTFPTSRILLYIQYVIGILGLTNIHHSHSVIALASINPVTPTISISHHQEGNHHQQQQRTVLVTGGAGYIGSHTCLELLQQPNNIYRVIVIDNLDNSSEESLRRVRYLVQAGQQQQHHHDDHHHHQDNNQEYDTNKNYDTDQRLIFRQCDIRDTDGLIKILNEFPDISSCIHFAGLKAVGQSVSQPLLYYDCNIAGTVSLLQLLHKYNIQNFVFSSSATVYGDPEILPITENSKLQATNPYGRTKLFIEEILRDCYSSDPSFWNILILRYFNPIGAHSSGLIGEDPQGIPNNLMPFISQVCIGRRDKLSIFGNDYDTIDGTGVRDYIHVVDLARGHVAALDKLYASNNDKKSCTAVNLGTGTGVSVLQLVNGMGKVTGNPVPYEISPRRPGDVATVYADPKLAQTLLSWSATKSIDDMCQDTWKWQSMNPLGYKVQQKIEEEEQPQEVHVLQQHNEQEKETIQKKIVEVVAQVQT
jgi:UDP-glucose 4-epimerase